MRNLNRPLLVWLSFFFVLQTVKPDANSVREGIFPYLYSQVSFGDTSICVLRDDLRFQDPNRFFSVFLIYGRQIVDSLSLDKMSSTGAKPVDLFLWRTESGKDLVCLEYNSGSGIGIETVAQTDLYIYGISQRKLNLLGTFCTDSVYYNWREKKIFEVDSDLDCNGDTLHIFREGWRVIVDAENMTKVHEFDLVTYVYWTGKRLGCKVSSQFPYFIRKW